MDTKRMNPRREIREFLACSFIFFICAQAMPATEPGSVSLRRGALVAAARGMIGKKAIQARGRKFAADCSGTVMAICWEAGLDLAGAAAKAKGANGVARIRDAFSRAGLLLKKGEYPQAGDIVFWDDTYDKNGNGRADDPLSHVGIVVSAEKGGQLTYVHYRYDKGVVEESMNLKAPAVKDGPEGKRLNSNVRMSSWKPDGRRLAGELYAGGGSTARFPEGWIAAIRAPLEAVAKTSGKGGTEVLGQDAVLETDLQGEGKVLEEDRFDPDADRHGNVLIVDGNGSVLIGDVIYDRVYALLGDEARPREAVERPEEVAVLREVAAGEAVQEGGEPVRAPGAGPEEILRGPD